MYGKFFASTFTGSMFGAGTDVFAVWGYVVANVVDSTVELNPPLLAAILGSDVERITQAIKRLTEPDPASRNPAENGRRLIHENGFQYRVTSHELYRNIRNEEERRAYNRKAQAKSRAKRKRPSNIQSLTQDEVSTSSSRQDDLSALSAHTDTEADTEEEYRSKIPVTNNKLVLKAGAVTTSESAAQKPHKVNGQSKRPIFRGQRLTVFEWMLEDLSQLLGPAYLDFGLDEFFDRLDRIIARENVVLPKAEVWPWLQSRVLAEAASRGLAIVTGNGEKPHKRDVRDAAALALMKRLNP